jgi:hypothetical protein
VEEGDHGGAVGLAVGLAVPESGEREGAGAGAVEEMMLTGGPDLSAGERGGRGKELASWAWPKKRKGSAGVWAKRPREREGEGFCYFSFSNKFSIHFLIGFLIKLAFCF